MTEPTQRHRLFSLLLLAVGAVAMAASLLTTGTAAGTATGQQQGPSVLAVTVDDSITPVVADHIVDGGRRAEAEGHQALLVELNTPGGLDASMREIVQSFLDADVPVVVHVAPQGARAASAGALITFSSHVAAMAPGTSIGAATPVDLQGGDEAGQKVIEDAAAFATSVADRRGRNTEFAEDAVRDGRAAAAREAVDINVVDLISAERAELLAEIDGTTVTLASGAETTLRTENAAVVRHEMGLFTGLLQVLANPNLAFLFISIGALGLIFELASPGAGIGGAIGAVLLVLGFFSLAVLPVNVAGILLLVLAVALFVTELFAPGIGAFAGGGAIALAAAGLFLFEGPFEVEAVVLWPTVVVIGLGAILAGRLALRARNASTVTGSSGLIGQETVVAEADGEQGRARVEGAWWNVRGDRRPLAEGQRVRVVDVEDLTLVVESTSREES